jgi:hypothetical protein
MTTDGRCPECSSEMETPNISGTVTADNLDLKKLAGLEDEKLPWHFKLLVALLCLYLGWRIIDLFF